MKRRFALVLFSLLFLVVPGLRSAAMPPGEWVTGMQIANPNAEDATGEILFYDQAGDVVLTFGPITVPAGGSNVYYLPTRIPDLPTGFMGSAVIASDLPLAASVNTQYPSGSSPMRSGTSLGVSSPASVVYATQLPKAYSGWNSFCAVQNAGAGTFDVLGHFFDSSGAEVTTETRSVPAFAQGIYDLSAIPDLPNGGMYSAMFEGDSSHPIAVVCNFYQTGMDASTSQFQSYNGLSEGAQTLYIPRLVRNYYGYQGGFKVQNVGTEALTVTVKYSFGGNLYTQVSPLIGPAQSWGPYMGAAHHLPPEMTTVAGSGSAVVTINDPTVGKWIIATVNEENPVDPAGRGVTYEAALPSDATDTVVFPQVVSEYYGYSGGIQVAKTSVGTASCTACYSAFGPISAFCENFTLTDAVPSWSQFAPNGSGMIAGTANDNYNGTVTVQCSGGTIVGIANMSIRYDRDTRYGNILGDSYTTVRGINQ